MLGAIEPMQVRTLTLVYYPREDSTKYAYSALLYVLIVTFRI